MHPGEAPRDLAGPADVDLSRTLADVERAETDTDVKRQALLAASRAVVAAARGSLIDHGIGYDPDLAGTGREWWARARLLGRTAPVAVVVEGRSSGLDALRDLADAVADRLAESGVRGPLPVPLPPL